MLANVTGDLTDKAFNYVGDTSMAKQFGVDAQSFEDGGVGKTLMHAVAGGTASLLMGESFATGAVSAGAREALSPLSENLDEDGQRLVSSLVGITAGKMVGGDSGAEVGGTIALSAEMNNRQLHQKEIKWIEEHAEAFAEQTGLSPEEAKDALAQQALRDVDAIWNVALGETDTKAQAFIDAQLKAENSTFENSRGEQQTLFSTEHGEFYDPSKYAAESYKADPSIYDHAKEKGKEVLSNPEELKKRLENTLNQDISQIPQRLNEVIDDLANKNPVEIVVDNLVDRANSLVDSAETIGGMATTDKETFDNIYGEGTGESIQTAGLVTGAIGAVVGKGKGGKSPSKKQSAKEFEKEISKLPPGERVAKIKEKARESAKEHGLSKDKTLSKKTGRDIYTDNKGNIYSVDTQHGRFEMLTKKGKHIDEVNFDLEKQGKTDISGGHDLNVK